MRKYLLLTVFFVSLIVALTLGNIPQPDYVDNRAETTPEELTRAYTDIGYSRYAHQYYVDNPWEQSAATGNTTFNQYWVDTDDLLKELLKRAYRQ